MFRWTLDSKLPQQTPSRGRPPSNGENEGINPVKNVFVAFVISSITVGAQADDQHATAEPTTSKPSADSRGKPVPDMRTHEGIWKPVAAVLGGVRLRRSDLKAVTLKVDGERYEVTVDGEEESDRGTVTLDTSTSPKRMTIKSTDGPNRGKTFLAIYEMKDAVSMRVCYDLSGTDFPKQFKAPKGTQLYLVGYRRQALPGDEPTTKKSGEGLPPSPKMP